MISNNFIIFTFLYCVEEIQLKILKINMHFGNLY